MAITFTAGASFDSETDSTSYQTTSGSVTSGDLIFAWIGSEAGTDPEQPGISGTNGFNTTWNLLGLSDDRNGGDPVVQLYAFWGIASSSTSGVITFTFTDNRIDNIAWGYCFAQGADTTTPIPANQWGGGAYDAGGANQTFSNGTSIDEFDLAVNFGNTISAISSGNAMCIIGYDTGTGTHSIDSGWTNGVMLQQGGSSVTASSSFAYDIDANPDEDADVNKSSSPRGLGIGFELAVASAADFPVTSAYMFKHITDVSSEPTNWSFVLAGGAAPQAAVAGAFRKAKGSDPVGASGTTTTGTNDMTPDSPDITTLADGAMIVPMHGYGYNAAAPTGGAPSGYTLVALAQGGSTDRGGVAMAYKTKPTAGLDTIGSWTHTDNAVAEWHARVIAIQPSVVSAATISEGPGIDDVTVSLSLDVHDDAGIDHSDLWVNTGTPATDGFVVQNNITPSQGDIIIDATVGPDTRFYYQLEDWEEVGETTSHLSNEVSLRTAPARPTNLQLVLAGNSFIDVSWTDNTDQAGGTGPHKHRVYYRQQGDPGWILATPTGVAAGINVYRIQNLEFATSYEWTVTAWNPSA